jgi:hypothetical protein
MLRRNRRTAHSTFEVHLMYRRTAQAIATRVLARHLGLGSNTHLHQGVY